MKVSKKYLIPFGAFFYIFILMALFGYGGDDIVFQYSSWLGYAESFSHGDFLPAWDGGANHGLGSPRFYFYPPLSHFLGGFIGWILTPGLIGVVYFWLCLIIAGSSAFVLGSLFVRKKERYLVSLLYMTSFYLNYCMLTRFAAAEALFNAILPLVVFYYINLFRREAKADFAILAILLSATWLMDVPIAIAAAYVLGFTSIIFSIYRKRIRYLTLYCLAQFSGILLASWYLVPAFMATSSIASTGELVYYYHPALSFFFSGDALLTSESLKEIINFAFSAISLVIFCIVVVRNRKDLSTRYRWLLLLLITAIPLFLQLPGTRFVWEWLPMFKIVGFNFRFLAFISLAVSILVIACFRGRERYALYLVWVGFLMVIIAGAAVRSHQAHDRGEHYSIFSNSDVYALRDNHQGVGEYRPSGTATANIGGMSEKVAVSNPQCDVEVARWAPEERNLQVYASSECTITLRTYAFPFWKVYIDGKQASLAQTSLIRFDIGKGRHDVRVAFEKPVANFWIGLGGLLAGLLLLWGSLSLLHTPSMVRSRQDSAYNMKAKSP